MSNKATKSQLIRIPEDKYAQLLLLDPSILDANHNVRYGSLNTLFNKLLNQHIERLQTQLIEQIKAASGPLPAEADSPASSAA